MKLRSLELRLTAPVPGSSASDGLAAFRSEFEAKLASLESRVGAPAELRAEPRPPPPFEPKDAESKPERHFEVPDELARVEARLRGVLALQAEESERRLRTWVELQLPAWRENVDARFAAQQSVVDTKVEQLRKDLEQLRMSSSRVDECLTRLDRMALADQAHSEAAQECARLDARLRALLAQQLDQSERRLRSWVELQLPAGWREGVDARLAAQAGVVDSKLDALRQETEVKLRTEPREDWRPDGKAKLTELDIRVSGMELWQAKVSEDLSPTGEGTLRAEVQGIRGRFDELQRECMVALLRVRNDLEALGGEPDEFQAFRREVERAQRRQTETQARVLAELARLRDGEGPPLVDEVEQLKHRAGWLADGVAQLGKVLLGEELREGAAERAWAQQAQRFVGSSLAQLLLEVHQRAPPRDLVPARPAGAPGYRRPD